MKIRAFVAVLVQSFVSFDRRRACELKLEIN
jgi:hypothetical protein